MFRRLNRAILICISCCLPAVSRGESDPSLNGDWRVVERGLGLQCPIRRLEIRTGANRVATSLTAYEEAGDAAERVAGTGTLRHSMVSSWETSWSLGSMLTRLSLTPSRDGRLTAIVRTRDAKAGPGGETVRQLILDRGKALERPVSDVPPRPVAPVEPRGDGGSELALLYRADVNGTDLKVVARPDGDWIRAADPAWSTDGKLIAFTSYDVSGRDPLIRVVPSDGNSTPVAIASGVGPRWSSDGSKVTYMASGKQDFATDWKSIGRNAERIEAVALRGPAAGRPQLIARGIWPRWSPTDDRLAFVAADNGNWDLYLRSADGLHLSRLTDDPATDTFPVWTRDGREVVFLSDRANRWDLYKVPASGGESRRLTNHSRREDQADLSPDGRQVAFTQRPGRPDSQILILDLARGSIRPLLPGSRGERDPSWSPDGRSVAFVSRRPSPLLPIQPAP